LKGTARDQKKFPASLSFIQWLHEEFYRNMPAEMLEIKSNTHQFQMKPGEYRSQLKHDNVIGKHIPPSSDQVVQFMKYFEQQYSFSKEGGRILTMAYAHHRFNYIHPFPDGNGRVSRLMSHAMGLKAGIGASGLWSISRGLARGLSKGISGRDEYKRFMSLADTPRQGEMDGKVKWMDEETCLKKHLFNTQSGFYPFVLIRSLL